MEKHLRPEQASWKSIILHPPCYQPGIQHDLEFSALRKTEPLFWRGQQQSIEVIACSAGIAYFSSLYSSSDWQVLQFSSIKQISSVEKQGNNHYWDPVWVSWFSAIAQIISSWDTVILPNPPNPNYLLLTFYLSTFFYPSYLQEGHGGWPWNYRPVSLTLTPGKMTDLLVLETISRHTKAKRWFRRSQHRFSQREVMLDTSNKLLWWND